MARWRIADDDYYWFITVYTNEGELDETDKIIHKELGVEPAQGELNLWRCRHCAAMVPGDGRKEHFDFHVRTKSRMNYPKG